MQIVGRKREIAELARLKESNQAEFVALYGRRRYDPYRRVNGEVIFSEEI